MLLEIHNGTVQARCWIATSVTWSATASGRFGTATFTVPRNHRLWTSGVMRPDGGQLVRLSDGPTIFAGVANAPTWDRDGARVTVLEVGEWVGRRVLLRITKSTWSSASGGAVRISSVQRTVPLRITNSVCRNNQSAARPSFLSRRSDAVAPERHALQVDAAVGSESRGGRGKLG